MRAREAGLVSLWFKQNTPDVGRCLHDKSNRLAKLAKLDSGDPLTLAALSGVFAVLLIGCVASSLLLMAESLSVYSSFFMSLL